MVKYSLNFYVHEKVQQFNNSIQVKSYFDLILLHYLYSTMLLTRFQHTQHFTNTPILKTITYLPPATLLSSSPDNRATSNLHSTLKIVLTSVYPSYCNGLPSSSLPPIVLYSGWSFASLTSLSGIGTTCYHFPLHINQRTNQSSSMISHNTTLQSS